jgi:putative ABC transport system ATP-binding protein
MIELAKVTQIFNPGTVNQNVAIDKLSLIINEGDFITVIGSNGAGKTTLLNIIAGVFLPTVGKIFIDSLNVTKLPEYKRARMIGRIFQNPLWGTAGNMTIEQNMALSRKKGFRYLRLALNPKLRNYFKEHLKTLGMGLENRMNDKVNLLSGGQRQALTLLTTILSQPVLLLLDEHTAALDPGNADAVMKLTDSFIQKHNITAMMVTHNMQQAIDYGNRLLMMDNGKIIFDVAGSEKQKLTVVKLVNIFKELRSSLMNVDEILLNTKVEV